MTSLAALNTASLPGSCMGGTLTQAATTQGIPITPALRRIDDSRGIVLSFDRMLAGRITISNPFSLLPDSKSRMARRLHKSTYPGGFELDGG